MIPVSIECITSEPDTDGNVQFEYRFIGADGELAGRAVTIGRQMIADRGIEYAARVALMRAVEGLPMGSGKSVIDVREAV